MIIWYAIANCIDIGPYDAVLAARQVPGNAPVDALKTSNEETLKATPTSALHDSLEKHEPLDNVALRPGDYSEENLMYERYEDDPDPGLGKI